MKTFLMGAAMVLLFTLFLYFQEDHDRFQRYDFRAKYAAEEAAAAAAQYIQNDQYGEGKLVFNQEEAIKAAEYMLKTHLSLDNQFKPIPGTYWLDQMSYKIEFFDESNTTFPKLYEHESNYFTMVITDPTVVITVNLGRPRYRVVFKNAPPVFRTAAHTWKER